MSDKPKATSTLGLAIDSKALIGAEVQMSQGAPSLLSLFQMPIHIEKEAPFNVKPLYNVEEDPLFQRALKESLVVTALPASEVLVRSLKIKLTKEKDIDSVLEFEAEPLLPYSVDEGIVDRITLKKNKEETRLTLVAAKTDHITQYLEQWNSLDIEPEVISCVPVGLAAFSMFFVSSSELHFHIHIGFAETTSVLVKEGKLLAAQTTQMGLDTLIEASPRLTEKAFYKLDFGSLDKDKVPELIEKIDQLRLEVTKHLYALSKRVSDQGVAELLITGEGTVLPGFAKTLCMALKKTPLVPEEKPGFSNVEQAMQFAAPIGIALGSLPKAQNQVNFRQKTLTYPYPWKRILKPMTTYLLLCVLLAFSIYIFTPIYIAHKETALKRTYVDLLAVIHKPYYEFENDFRSRTGVGEQYLTNEAMNAINLSQQDLEARLIFLEKELRASPDLFPLYPRSPRVLDVLAWLSTHPHIVGENKEKTLEKPRIQLKSFSYKMVKRPEPNKEKERYQVKVELEFTTPTPRFAREFHDILLAPNDIIDPREEVKWAVEQNSYRTSFFLQDKTGNTRSRR